MMKYKVYDKVWTMRNDKPQQFLIYAVIQEMALEKTKVDTKYRIVPETFGACWDDSTEVREENLWDTKEGLVESLL